MMPGWRVLLSNLRYLIGWKSPGQSHQGGPEAAMHKCDLAVDQAAHENVLRFGHDLQDREDLTTLRMAPPAAFDRLAGDRLRQARNGAFG